MLEIINTVSLIFSQVYSLCNYPPMFCSPFDRFRRPDGICNNPAAPYWGVVDSPLRRLVSNEYADGLSQPRIKGDKYDLPDVRDISNMISFDSPSDKRSIYTNLHQVFGQFVDHDISFTPNLKDKNEKKIQCCTKDGEQHPNMTDKNDCFIIDISEYDSFFKPRKCMNFVRSVYVTNDRLKCRSSAREQLNKHTSFVDASHIYDTSKEKESKLRTMKNGLMKTSDNNLLPELVDGDCIKRENKSDMCFLTGDMPRGNVHPGLTSQHVIFVRLHNQIATKLNIINGRNMLWRNDERLFQETRKIVEAVLQNIIYNEWLPTLIGDAATLKYKIKSSRSSPYRFENTKDARIINAFSTAAFRYGHSSIPSDWTYGDNKVPLVTMFKRPYFLQDFNGRGLGMIIEGMLKDSSQDSDELFTDGIRNNLFKTLKMVGLDLIAINLQRGREHGIASYNSYRKYCGLKSIDKFDGSTEQIKKLAKVYRNPEDVDLFVGGMTEAPVGGGIVGPTFACIIGEQFHNIKYGDRFWFENRQPPTPYLSVNRAALSMGQITAIRKIKMSRIICDTVEEVKYISRDAFLHPSVQLRNRRVSCQDYYNLPKLDLSKWRASWYG